jgi:hypothetical protein
MERHQVLWCRSRSDCGGTRGLRACLAHTYRTPHITTTFGASQSHQRGFAAGDQLWAGRNTSTMGSLLARGLECGPNAIDFCSFFLPKKAQLVLL